MISKICLSFKTIQDAKSSRNTISRAILKAEENYPKDSFLSNILFVKRQKNEIEIAFVYNLSMYKAIEFVRKIYLLIGNMPQAEYVYQNIVSNIHEDRHEEWENIAEIESSMWQMT